MMAEVEKENTPTMEEETIQLNYGTDGSADSSDDEEKPKAQITSKRRSLRARNKPDGYVPVEQVACCGVGVVGGESGDGELFLRPSRFSLGPATASLRRLIFDHLYSEYPESSTDDDDIAPSRVSYDFSNPPLLKKI